MAKITIIKRIKPIIKEGKLKGFFIRREIRIDTNIEQEEESELEKKERKDHKELVFKAYNLAAQETPISTKWEEIDDLLEKIETWSLLELFTHSFNLKEEELESTYERLKDYLESNKEIHKRFALSMFRNHYVSLDRIDKYGHDSQFIDTHHLQESYDELKNTYLFSILDLIDKKYKDEETIEEVVKLIAAIFKEAPSLTYAFLEANYLDTKTQNKTIGRILEIVNIMPKAKYMISQLRKEEWMGDLI